MPAPALIRESFFGYAVYLASGRRYFKQPEEQPGFEFSYSPTPTPSPPTLTRSITPSPNPTIVDGSRTGSQVDVTDAATVYPKDEEAQVPQPKPRKSQETIVATRDAASDQLREKLPEGEKQRDLENGILDEVQTEREVQSEIRDSHIVSWYGSDDPENPLNVCVTYCPFITNTHRLP